MRGRRFEEDSARSHRRDPRGAYGRALSEGAKALASSTLMPAHLAPDACIVGKAHRLSHQTYPEAVTFNLEEKAVVVVWRPAVLNFI